VPIEPPLIKICGLTAPDEAAACAALGVWAIGVVFAAESPRRVDVERARAVLGALPPATARVGVFVGSAPREIAAVATACGLTHAQVHGVDPAATRAATGLPVIEGIGVDGPESLERARASAADLVMLDASVPGRHGGTGRAFDWGLLDASGLGRPFVLAGGLTPDTVAGAVGRARPDAVDVSSGVESAPGRKDPALVRRFVEAVELGARMAA
jgi:phosphoribosylanthranilate isomerase